MVEQMQFLMEINLDFNGIPCSNWSGEYASVVHPHTCGKYASLIAFGNFLVAATFITHFLIAHVMFILPVLF
ncbi:Large-conductance mechanosensitive channel [Trichinella pseudospiralis]|uniref:Transmembrane protein n=2 Tax=Trichinella pseudospiralis TaxID=6337 RepID=A0A0V1G8D4_TRIPS|nr:hypothetical protein T4D_13058 [Trichinella pseudospiralis]